VSTVEKAVMLAREIAKVAEGFAGEFQFDPEHTEHTEDHGSDHSNCIEYDNRLMYVPAGDDEAWEIACGIEPHIAAPMAAMLEAAGPLARALLALTEKMERLEALVSNLRTGVINACDAACDSIDQRRFLRQVRHTANQLNLPFDWDAIVEDFAASQLEPVAEGSLP
jgi:hypothetical protein